MASFFPSGGEPLLGHDTISFICKSLAEWQVSFYSSMVTNASLVTEELIREMKNVWKLKMVQVSLDGERQDYAMRKRYLQPEKYTYDTVMKAIHLLADNGIKTKLAINFDHENIGQLESFLEKLDGEFGNYENVFFIFNLLDQDRVHNASCDLYRQGFSIIESFESHGGHRLRQYYLDGDRKELPLQACNSMESILIAPDGSFHNCLYQLETFSWGNIFDGVTDQTLYEKLRAPTAIDDECRHCPFLPECTPFRRRHCPKCSVWCRENKTLFESEKLHRLIKKLLNPEVKK